MDKELIGYIRWIGLVSIVLVNDVAAIVREKGRCKQEQRVVPC